MFIIIPAMISESPSIIPPPHIQASEPILSARFCGLLAFAIVFIAAITILVKIKTPT